MTKKRSFAIGLSVIGGCTTCAFALFFLTALETIRMVSPYVVMAVSAIIIIGGGAWLAKYLSGTRTVIHADSQERKKTETMNQFDIQERLMDLHERNLRLMAQMEMLPELMRQAASGMSLPRSGVAGIEMAAYPAMTTRNAQQQITAPLPVFKPLLPELANAANILVVGKKGSGKTTVLQWLEEMRKETGHVIVLDSHAKPAQWQGHMVGIGRQYGAIKDAMIGLANKLNDRYHRRAEGKANWRPVHTIIDEFTILPNQLKKQNYQVTDQFSIPMLTEGRKVDLNCIWGIHSADVKTLGMEGQGALRENFDAVVYLKHNAQTNERYAYVDFGEGIDKDVRYAHPGPFVIHGQSQPVNETATMLLDKPAPPQPSILDGEVIDTESAVINARLDGKSYNECYRIYHQITTGESWPTGNRLGSQHVNKIKEILRRHGYEGA